MKEDLQVKRRFFALYWGQKIMKKNIKGLEDFYSEPDGFIRSMTLESHLFLELKSLEKISNNEIINISYIINAQFSSKYSNDVVFSEIRKLLSKPNNLSLLVVDFLRSKGYALPYLDMSVSALVEVGWVFLK